MTENGVSEIAYSGKGVAAIVVTFNSDVSRLVANLRPLESVISSVIISDNSTDSEIRNLIRIGCAGPGYNYLDNNGNVGIAEAQNRAVQRAKDLDCSHFIFLDDDSMIRPEAVRQLVRAYESAHVSDSSVVAVGPLIRDARSKEALVFRWEGWRLRRFQGPYGDNPIEVAFMLSSGTLTSLQNFETVGEFRSDYFIDHVDLEWGIRASSMGCKLLVIPTAEMVHALGDSVKGGTDKKVHRYSHTNHVRDYYLARNLIALVRETNLAPSRKLGLLLRLSRELCRTLLLPGRRWQKFTHQTRGLWHGLRGRSGEFGRNHPGST